MHNHKHRFGLLPPLSSPLAAPATPSQWHPEAPRSIGAGRRPVPALFVSALLLCVLCASAVPLQATTVQGSVFDAAGQPLASGEIILRLSQEGTVTDPALLLIQPPVSCTITSGAIAGGCTVRGNDTISPAATFYKVRIITSTGQELLPERNYTITGATFDIGTATPLASATVAATAYQQIQDEGTNITKTNIANFTGSGVTVTHDAANNRTNISITGGGAGATHQIDGINLTAQDPINLQDTAEIDFTNPAVGNIQAALKAASIADSKLASNYSGIGSCAASQWVNALNDNAAPTCAQPGFSDLSGSATLGQLPVGTANQLIKTNAGASSQEHATLSGTASEIDVSFGAGTITIGLVDPLAIAKGGTGATTASAAFDALSPMTTLGDVIYGGTAGTGTRLAGNTTTAKQFLTQTGTGAASAAPAWGTIAPGDLGSGFLDAVGDLAAGLCTASQILKKNAGNTAWECAADDTGAGGGYATIQEEGASLTQRNTLNFIGPAVTAADDAPSTRTNLTIVASGVGSCAASQWVNALSDGAAPTCAQPAFSDFSGSATKAQLPAAVAYEDEANIFTVAGGVTMDNQLGIRLREATGNGTSYIEHRAAAALAANATYTWPVASAGFARSTAGGVLSWNAAAGTGSCAASNFATALNDDAAPTCAQPAFSDLSGSATLAQLPVGTANQLIKTNAGASSQEHATLSGTASEIDVTFGAGTITIGLVDPLAIAKGGTGAATASAAFDALSPMTTLGDVIYGGTSGTGTRLAGNVTTTKQFLTQTGTGAASAAPAWSAIADGDVPGTITRDTEWPSATATLTNKTVDVEATGNAITTVRLEEFPAATCIAATATLNWDDSPTLAEPAAACITGTNITYGVADFDAATDEGMQISFVLPTGWTGNIDFDYYWHAAAITGSVVWALETICVADAETLDPAFNAAQTVTDAAKGTANQLNNATISTVTTTGCAAGERMFLELSRDANNASDDMTGDARLVSTRITMRRTQ